MKTERYKVKMLRPAVWWGYPVKWILNFLGDEKLFEGDQGHNLIGTRFCRGFRWGDFRRVGNDLDYDNKVIFDRLTKAGNDAYNGEFNIRFFWKLFFVGDFRLTRKE